MSGEIYGLPYGAFIRGTRWSLPLALGCFVTGHFKTSQSGSNQNQPL